MGNRLNAILNRLFDYPIKRKPICFYRQEDFASTGMFLNKHIVFKNIHIYLGEPLPKMKKEQKGPPTEYDKLVEAFYSRLLAQRRHTRQMQEKNRRWSVQKVMKRFPGWNEMTIANLHSLFLLFDNNLNGMLSFEDLYVF